jgi:hypothetical protein
MEKDTDTDKILRAIAGVHARVDTVVERVDTLAERVDTVVEMVGSLQGQVSSMETDIKTIKGDVRDVHKRVDHVEDDTVSHAEFNLNGAVGGCAEWPNRWIRLLWEQI